jgi:hypothetical protein
MINTKRVRLGPSPAQMLSLRKRQLLLCLTEPTFSDEFIALSQSANTRRFLSAGHSKIRYTFLADDDNVGTGTIELPPGYICLCERIPPNAADDPCGYRLSIDRIRALKSSVARPTRHELASADDSVLPLAKKQNLLAFPIHDE